MKRNSQISSVIPKYVVKCTEVTSSWESFVHDNILWIIKYHFTTFTWITFFLQQQKLKQQAILSSFLCSFLYKNVYILIILEHRIKNQVIFSFFKADLCFIGLKEKFLDERQKKHIFLDFILLSSLSLLYHHPYNFLHLYSFLSSTFSIFCTSQKTFEPKNCRKGNDDEKGWESWLQTDSSFSFFYIGSLHSVSYALYNCIVGTMSFLNDIR